MKARYGRGAGAIASAKDHVRYMAHRPDEWRTASCGDDQRRVDKRAAYDELDQAAGYVSSGTERQLGAAGFVLRYGSMVQFADQTYREIAQLAEQECLALVPTGCTEQQGPHLPVSFDTWLVGMIARVAADEVSSHGVRVLVLPAMPFGPTPEHRGFGSGNTDLPRDLHEAVIEHVLSSLADQGFRRFNEQHAGQAKAFVPDLP